MKWVKRGLWAAGWSSWAWLGVGLHRELPRDLGPTVSRRQGKEEISVVGFLGEGDAVLGQAMPAQIISLLGQERTFYSWESQTGRELQEVGPFVPTRSRGEPRVSLHHGVVIEGSDFSSDGSLIACRVWDLRTRGDCKLPRGFGRVLDVHPTWPLVALESTSQRAPRRIGLADLRDGSLVAAWDLWKSVPDSESIDAGYFNDRSTTSILLKLRSRETGIQHLLHLDADRQTISNPIGLPPWCHKTRHPQSGRFFVSGFEVEKTRHPHGERLFLSGFEHEKYVTSVIDTSSGAVVWSRRVTFQPDDLQAYFLSVGASDVLAPSGRLIFEPLIGLTDLGTGHAVWSKTKDFEEPIPPEVGAAAFWVRECWGTLAKKIGASVAWTTWALRDIETGRLIVRLRERVDLNEKQMLAVASDGAVYPWPAHVNYPLLALCQSILALPLVLLWAALWWRRKRRMRLADAAQ